MQYSARFVVLIVAVSISLNGLITEVNASTRVIPPLFRENPNLRLSPEIRADEDVDYRLPNKTTPYLYTVELTTNVHTGETAFSGEVVIEFTVEEATSEIVLHARELEIVSASLQSIDNPTSSAVAVTTSYEEKREFLTVTVSNAQTVLAVDTKWALTIKYTGELRSDNGGFYLSTYTDDNGNTRYLATTQFESTDARHAFPCYDEPAKRAQFVIKINHDPSYNAISNMPVNEAASSSGVTVFETTVNMPTYLVAFIVSDFEWTEGQLNSLKQRVYSRPGTEHEQEWALVSGMLILERLADYYGVKFALPKVDQVAVPDFAAGAMENWGLVTYREEYLLYNTEKSTVSTQTNIANIIAHEYTHQWFGNLVAIKWWTFLWLKEGFATLFSYQAADDAYPEWDIYQLFHSEYQSALVSDGANTSRPMTHYVQTPSEIGRLYDTISYGKAGSVLHMWQNALTDAVFQRGLNNYLTANQYSAAEEDQLFEAIQTAAKELNYELKSNITNMMSTWTRQGGFPLLTVTRNYDDGSFTITQEPFYNDVNYKAPKSWFVPVNYAVQSKPDFRNTEATHYLLNVSSISVSDKISSDDWLILNKQSTGYYRINYDERNWNLIIDGLNLKSHKVHPRNRAQLMHDAYRLSISGRLSQSILLSLMTYLTSEDQYAPWSTANSIITVFNRYLSGDADYDNFKFYIGELVGPIYDKLGVNDIPGEQHFQKNIRSIAINLACLAGIESCLEETNNKLKGLIDDGIAIEPNLQSQTFCNGLRQSDNKEYDYVYNMLMTSEDQAQRRILISSLGCSQDETQLKKFVESSIDESNSLRTQERTTLLSAAYSRGEVGLLTSIDFLDVNWETYAKLTAGFGGSNPLDSDLRSMSQYVVNEDQQAKLMALVDKVKGSEYVSDTIETTVQNNIQSNFNWLSDNRDPLMSWINTYKTGDGAAVLTSSIISIAVASMLLLLRFF